MHFCKNVYQYLFIYLYIHVVSISCIEISSSFTVVIIKAYLLLCLSADALAACHYIPQVREKIFKVLFSALNSTVSDLQVAGEQCMKKVCSSVPGRGQSRLEA